MTPAEYRSRRRAKWFRALRRCNVGDMPAGTHASAAILALAGLATCVACSSGKLADPPARAGSGSAQVVKPTAGSAAAAAATGSAESAAPIAPDAPAESSAPLALPLIIGDRFGLSLIDSDGKVLKQLSTTPTSHPRWTADHRALVFLSERGELRRLELATGKETVIARLPAKLTPCEGQTIERTELRIQSDEDFAFNKRGDEICIRLQDRNINMADIVVAFRVELATGKVEPTIEMSRCEHEAGSMPQGCHGDLPDGPSPPREARPYEISDGVLVHGASRKKLGRARDYHEEEISPSGKWAVVGGNLSNGDYIERDVFLLDRDTGKLYPLPESARKWPAPISTRQLGKLQAWSGKTIMAVGETRILWLGQGDRLVIGQALIVPGVRISHFEGDLAR